MNQRNRASLVALLSIIVFVAVLLLTLIALDVFTVPYVTPFAHVLKTIITPLAPIFLTLYPGLLIKLYRHAPFPARKQWMFSFCGISFQALPRLFDSLENVYQWSRLYDGRSLMGEGAVCGLRACAWNWEMLACFSWMLVGEYMGWKWEGGYMQRWVDAVAAESIRKEKEGAVVGEAVSEMEKGRIEVVEVVDEKKPLV